MIIAGIDYSLTCPAICVHDSHDGDFNFHNAFFFFRSNLQRFDKFNENRICGENHGPWKTDEERYDDIASWALEILMSVHRVDKVYLEGYSYGSTGKVFNIGSTKQLQEVFYDILKLPILKKTPKGKPSTNEDVLQELSLDHKIPKLILQYRNLMKLIKS